MSTSYMLSLSMKELKPNQVITMPLLKLKIFGIDLTTSKSVWPQSTKYSIIISEDKLILSSLMRENSKYLTERQFQVQLLICLFM